MKDELKFVTVFLFKLFLWPLLWGATILLLLYIAHFYGAR